MPNLIHSLDGTSIALLYNDFKDIGSIYTIHDCFAVTAENILKLISMLKFVYLKLYSEEDYLLKFDKLIRLTINGIHGDNVLKMDGLTINIPMKRKFKTMDFPDIKKVLNLSDNNKITNLMYSSYIIK